MKTVILSLGGSIIVPDKIDINFLKKFRTLIKSQRKKFVIVCGGGKVCRDYINSAKKIKKNSNFDLDMVGIKSTQLNAELLRCILSDISYKSVHPNYNKKVNFKKVLVSAGLVPGTSTDFDAVKFAEIYKAIEVINLSNIDYVFDKDPKKFKDAKPLKKISWKDFRKIVGNKWSAGMNWPFDPIASKLAEKLKLKVIILNGTNLPNLKKALNGKDFIGTIIS